MLASRPILSTLAVCLLAGAASAQLSRGSSFGRTIGNSDLGGTAFASATASIQTTSTLQFAGANAFLHGSVRLLGTTAEAFEFRASASAAVSGITQYRLGQFSAEINGFTYVSQSFSTNGSVAPRSLTYRVFPADVRAVRYAGSFPVTLTGNVASQVSFAAGVSLPAGAIAATLTGGISARAVANASVATTTPGTSASLSFAGGIYDQVQGLAHGADWARGFLGAATHSLGAISLRFAVTVRYLFFSFTNTLTSYGAPAVFTTLF